MGRNLFNFQIALDSVMVNKLRGMLTALVIVFGIKPGFFGYRWHARVLEEEEFAFKCTVAAESRRKALKAANDNQYNDEIHIAAA